MILMIYDDIDVYYDTEVLKMTYLKLEDISDISWYVSWYVSKICIMIKYVCGNIFKNLNAL